MTTPPVSPPISHLPFEKIEDGSEKNLTGDKSSNTEEEGRESQQISLLPLPYSHRDLRFFTPSSLADLADPNPSGSSQIAESQEASETPGRVLALAL